MARKHKSNPELSPKKRALLNNLIRSEGLGSSVSQTVPVKGARAWSALSFAQKRLWFINELEPNNPVYNDYFSLRLKGQVNVATLQQCIDEIINRHDALRTTFNVVDVEPAQVVASSKGFKLQTVDLSDILQSTTSVPILELAVEEARRPFNLERGPLLRMTLIRTASDEGLLLFTIHHIISDGWSLGILIKELAILYEAYSIGAQSALSELPIQYGDFAEWHKKWVEETVLRSQLPYWKKKLANAPSILELPFDHPRPATRSYSGCKVALDIPSHLNLNLKQFSRQNGATIFMVLMAAFKALLHRYTGQDDILIGAPIAGRSRSETEGLIGLFANLLALRTEVCGGLSFEECLARCKETAVSAFAHQDLPFEIIVEELNPERGLSYNPVFQVVFALQEAPPEVLKLPRVTLQRVDIDAGTTKFDLTLDFIETELGLKGTFEYNTELFEIETIERMRRHYLNLLGGALVHPQCRVIELPLMSEQERQEVIVGWNQTAAEYPRDRCVHELYEEQVGLAPDAVAVVYEGEQLSYHELNRRANQLAHYLQKHGLGAEVKVGLCVERSLELIVGLLGIMKAGAAYLPLDADYPQERLAYIIKDAGCRIILCKRHHLEKLIETETTLLRLDADWGMIALHSDERSAAKFSNDNLAYVIYTSGSTGQPKGVMVEHANITRLFSATAAWFHFDQNDVWTLFHSIAFDFSVWEIWGALIHGARLVVVPRLTTRSPSEFYQLLHWAGVTILNQTPSAFRQLIAAQGASRQTHQLRRVIFGGEALEVATLKPWRQDRRNLHTRLINMYGITEATVHVTYRPLELFDSERPGSSPIGKRIPDLKIYLLDDHGQPVPIGVTGEMYVGGAGVARGYLNQPELTAERFVTDPFAGEPGARMYRTGDLARYLPDGDIEFLGRNDFQVKIRGFRIELGEIEAQLARHPDVRDAVVLARENGPGDKRLVAYYVAATTEATATRVDAETLRTHLSAALPEHMVPAAYVMLEALPLTSNNKLDRRALPAPDGDAYAARDYEAPVGEIETALARIWADLLQLERVGRHDNFFALGGHSLLALTLIERMRREELHANVRTLFTTPTLAALAAACGDSGVVEVPPNRIPPACEAITPEMLPLARLSAADIEHIVGSVPGGAANVQDIYPLAPLQEGILFHHLMVTEGDPYLLHGLYGFDTRSRLDGFLQALQAAIDRHDILRTAVHWEGLPEPVQVVWRQAPLIIEEIGFKPGASGVAEQLQARFDPRRHRFDIRQAPLMRVYIAHDALNDRWVMMHLFHHLSIDRTTEDILLREVRAHLLGRTEELPAPLPFRNFVAQARQGVSWEEQEAFFRAMLSDIDEPTTPYGLANVQGDGTDIRDAWREVNQQLAGRLRQASRALGVSNASLYHLAWAQVVALVSGRDDVVFGTVLFGRMQGGEGADRVPGMFINTLPVRIRVGVEGVQEGVRQTHSLLTQLLRHEHASLALAQRCSAVAAPAPLFSALLNYRHSRMADDTADTAEEALPAWEGIEFLSGEERTNYPFILNVSDWGKGFGLNAQVQSPIDPDRVCAYMHTVLEQLVEALENAPSTPVCNLNTLPASERHQLIVEWNATRAEYPRDRCIHELFEAQAARTPQAVAVVAEGRQLTYGELNRRANRLAHHLRKLGVKPDERVGLCMERSLEMVVGLMAILKAGGAYLPLDPDYPQERLTYMIKDAECRIILCKHNHVEKVIETRTELLRLDADWKGIEDQSGVCLAAQVTADNLAYVIYTSGSTGRPKGVAIEHRSATAFLFWAETVFGPEDRAEVVASTSICFDLSVFELFLPLCWGGKIVLVQHSLDIVDVAKTNQPTLINTVPSAMAEILRAGGLPESLRVVNLAGEPLSNALVAAIRQRSDARVLDLYGPSETTTYSTFAVREPDAPQTIGGPILNTQIYLMDNHWRPAPIGAIGELYIGGLGVSRCYLNRPYLTAERFIANPWGEPGARMYRTGDLARWSVDGRLRLLGRVDNQVKIRGFRIELGEIETLLSEHPAVREVAVIARKNQSDNAQLIAYLVIGSPQPPTYSELRRFLRQRLPDYMAPGAIVQLEAMPMTPNGKLDRKALPEPEFNLHKESFVAPRNAIEEILCGIWSEVLRVERVGAYDNFFELGGHSLLAMQAASRIQGALGVDVSLRSLFSDPTPAAVAIDVERRQKMGEKSDAPPLVRVERSRDLPLSYAQRRLWFIDQLEPGSAGYNIPCALRVRGELKPVLLEQVLGEVVRRHEVLRTRFEVRGDHPVQVIEDAMPVSAPVIDVSGLKERQRERGASRIVNEEAARSFDLSRGPLIRAVLVRLREQEQIVLLTMHHIVSDEWSSGVLIREVSALYEAYSKGEASPLPELPIQYADYAAWQREWLQGGAVDEQIVYWGDKLKEMETLVLPTDRPRPPLQSNQLAREAIVLSQELTDSVRALSRREGVTMFMLLLSVFKTLLHRYTGETDLPIGSLITNRNRREIEGLIGFFVNTLVLRTDLSGDPSFCDLLGRVRQVALEAYGRQELPFERLVEELQPERSLNRTPLFQVMFILQNAPLSAIEIEGLQLRIIEIERRTANFDLVLSLGEAGDRLGGLIDYKKELFDRDRIGRLAGHLEVMLAEVVKQPGQRLSQLTLLTESERRQLVEWNCNDREYGPWRSVTVMIAEQAALRGEALAVECEGHALSYAELDWRASRLANYLRSREVGPEQVVGVAMRRSVGLVVGLLAILKAGAAYLPLDNEYPIERIRYMLSDAGVKVLLSESGVSREGWGYEGEALCLDEEWEQIGHYVNEDCNEGVSEENLAYVIYTSGSTGRPKAVMNTHRGLHNRLMWMQDAYHLDETDCVLQKTPFSFDVSVWEFFWPLMTGAKLAVARPDGHKDSGYLVKAIEDHQVTTLHFVPSMLRVFLDEQKVDWCRSVKRVICSGEALSVDLQRMFFDSLDAGLFNLYGPTEASIDVTHWACHVNNEQVSVPIGRPIANTQIRLLEKSLRSVPIGIAGELCIGGAGLGRGYLSRADLTAERFIPDPFGQTHGARLYKTGDLARYLRDGSIDFLGRLDYQVKIRGVRIELGEIDAALKQHPSVSDSAVVATGDAYGDRRLIAYIVTARDRELTVEELRNFVKDRLPEYMAPATFVFMQAMPLTSSGKLDRRRLPASDDSRTEPRKSYVAPRTPIEEEMASIWQELLKKERVGIYDNFFEEGGHSLLLTQLASRIRKTFDIEVPLRALFDAPTIVEVTKAIVERQINRLDSHRLEDMVNQLRQLSPQEIRALLEYRGQNSGGL